MTELGIIGYKNHASRLIKLINEIDDCFVNLIYHPNKILDVQHFTNNLNDFSLMSKDEVLNHRKNKFLSIGRSKGFISETQTDDSLHMKQNFLDILKIKIIKNKNQLIIASIVLILTALIFLML